MGVFMDALGDAVDRSVQPFKAHNTEQAAKNAGLPPPPSNPARTVQQVAGGVMGALQMPLELANTGFAVATGFIADMYPSLDAAALGSLYVGPPHAHLHPPSYIWPAPPIPLPSLGPVVLGTSVQVLINGMPAARAGDIGSAPTCGGFFPFFEIFLGSSNVFISGMRAARIGDLSKACTPATSASIRGMAGAMFAAGQAIAIAGVIADATEAMQSNDPAMSEALGLSAQMGAAQAIADAATLAVTATMGTDMALPPAPGALTTGSANVKIGGFPMINFPDPAMMLFGAIGRKLRRNKAQNAGCGVEGEPVDVVTGAAFDTIEDFELPGPLPLTWSRYHSSDLSQENGPLGWGFRHFYQRELRRDLDGFCYTDAEGMRSYLPPIPEGESQIAQDGVLIHRLKEGRYEVSRFGEPKMIFKVDRTGIGRLDVMEDNNGKLRFYYDAAGRLDGISGSLQQEVKLVYDRLGHITAVKLVERKTRQERALAQYLYDQAGHLVAHVDAQGKQATYAYDASHRMTRKTDRRGYSFHYNFDPEGRCVRTRGSDGKYDVRLSYNALERSTEATSADGGTRTYYYNEQGTITLILDPYGGAWERRLDDHGLLQEEVDPNKNVTKVLYDEFGGAVAKVDALGRLLTVENDLWNGEDNPGLDFDLPESALEWTHGGSPAKVGRIKSTDSVLVDLPEKATGIFSALVKDEQPVVPETLGPKQDDAGRIRWEEQENGILRQRAYDVEGRILTETTDRRRTEQWQYDEEGNIRQYRDADGATFGYGYNSWNFLNQEADPLGQVTHYNYSGNGKIKEIIDPGGTKSSYEYDQKDRVVSIRRNGRVMAQYDHDLADNPVTKRDGQGNVLMSFEIGPGNLPIKRHLASGETHTFDYDEQGRIIEMSTGDVDIELDYTPLGKTRLDLRDGLGVEHFFEGGQWVESSVFERFSIFVDEDEKGTRFIQDPLGGVHQFSQSEGGLVHAKLANGTSIIEQYDENGRCLRTVAVEPNGTVFRRDYRYSLAGDLKDVQDSRTGQMIYEYDKAHRLVAERTPDGKRQVYSHDRAGNLLGKPGLSGVRIGERNHLAQANGSHFYYNSRDHLSRREGPEGTTHYDYDARDMLVQVSGPALDWRATYDPMGRRLSKQWGDKEVTFYWDGDRLAAEQDKAGRLRLYLYSDPEALVPFMFIDYENADSEPETGQAYYLTTDQLGVPIQVTDAEGRTVWRARVDPYGTVHVEQGADFHQPLRFPGHYFDAETGLHYNRYRYYSPELGRFLQTDPLDTEGGINVYAYASNPLTQVDLLGLKCMKAIFRGSDEAATGKKKLIMGNAGPAEPQAHAPRRPQDPRTGPRPVYGQEHDFSCAIASIRMMVATVTGRNVPESHLRMRSQVYPGAFTAGGTFPNNLPPLMRDYGLHTPRYYDHQSIDDLQRATANGYPAIAIVQAPNAPVAHAIVVDGVLTNPDGSRTVFGRDPWPPGQGEAFAIPEEQFVRDKDFRNTIFPSDPNFHPGNMFMQDNYLRPGPNAQPLPGMPGSEGLYQDPLRPAGPIQPTVPNQPANVPAPNPGQPRRQTQPMPAVQPAPQARQQRPPRRPRQQQVVQPQQPAQPPRRQTRPLPNQQAPPAQRPRRQTMVLPNQQAPQAQPPRRQTQVLPNNQQPQQAAPRRPAVPQQRIPVTDPHRPPHRVLPTVAPMPQAQQRPAPPARRRQTMVLPNQQVPRRQTQVLPRQDGQAPPRPTPHQRMPVPDPQRPPIRILPTVPPPPPPQQYPPPPRSRRRQTMVLPRQRMSVNDPQQPADRMAPQQRPPAPQEQTQQPVQQQPAPQPRRQEGTPGQQQMAHPRLIRRSELQQANRQQSQATEQVSQRPASVPESELPHPAFRRTARPDEPTMQMPAVQPPPPDTPSPGPSEPPLAHPRLIRRSDLNQSGRSNPPSGETPEQPPLAHPRLIRRSDLERSRSDFDEDDTYIGPPPNME